MQNSNDREMIITWPELNSSARASFLRGHNPELCEVVEKNLPLETIQSHGVIAGGLLMAPTRIVCTIMPQCVENLAQQRIGRINFSLFYLALSMKYAPINEPLDISPIGQIVDENIETFQQVGERVWQHTCDLSRDKGYIRVVWRLS